MRPLVRDRILRIKFGTDLPVDVVEAVDDWCRGNKVRKNLVTELALRRFLAEGGVGKEAGGGE